MHASPGLDGPSCERGVRVQAAADRPTLELVAQGGGLRELGVIPVDYRDEDVSARVREISPEGAAAVFDHVGGPGIVSSWRMPAPGGTLVSYGTLSTRDQTGNPRKPVLKIFGRIMSRSPDERPDARAATNRRRRPAS